MGPRRRPQFELAGTDADRERGELYWEDAAKMMVSNNWPRRSKCRLQRKREVARCPPSVWVGSAVDGAHAASWRFPRR